MFLFFKYSKIPNINDNKYSHKNFRGKKNKRISYKSFIHTKTNLILIIIKIILLIIFFSFSFFIYNLKSTQKNKNKDLLNSKYKRPLLFGLKNKEKFELFKKTFKIIEVNKTYDFEKSTFAILRRTDCSQCGLFSYYSVHFGCILTYLSKGYIPIIDVNSFENIFNNFEYKPNNTNPWETLFNQPFGYTLDEVKKNAKKIENIPCVWTNMAPSEGHVYSSELTLNFYRKMTKKYMPLKKEIIKEVNTTWIKLFNNSNNILGVIGRGTDFINLKPGGHSIPPSTEQMIEDVNKMNKKYNYDWIYLATEDDNIREKFINNFKDKIKMIQNKNISYTGGYIGDNKNLHGIKFQKLYLKSMIMASKCIDIVSARCSGSMGAFIFAKGFRNTIVYFLGQF